MKKYKIDIDEDTSTKGTTRLNSSQISIIFTYAVIGREFETLMNLEYERIGASVGKYALVL